MAAHGTHMMATPQDRDTGRDDRPPEWAEELLRLVLRRDRRECVSGDLLEEYRAEILPARGPERADRWYVRQVAGYVWRTTWFWAVLFFGAQLARTALDWLVPTTDFHVRSNVTTALAVGILASASLWAGWRSQSFVSGALVAAVTTQVSALMTMAVLTIMLTLWHDPATWNAIANSGGLAEAYTLPFFMVIPALIVGAAGGVVGKVGRLLRNAA